MDYEKLYKEALERAKELSKTTTGANYEYIFPELKESEDERIRKSIIAILNNYVDNSNTFKPKMLAWLEKQGEQKPHEYTLEQAAGIFLDALSNTPYNNKPITDAQVITKELLKFLEDTSSYNPNAINEQAPADKVEPKFHEGDWVVYNNDICQIVKREEGCNKLVTTFGIVKELVNERNLSTARLWTIQDAKVGDVLASKNEDNILIFRNLDTNTSFSSYYNIAGKGELGWSSSRFIPATKEQRDLLFQKMKEAGYEWDAEKKELRKIEQNLSNSPEIGKNDTLLDLLRKIPSYITVDGIDYHFVLKKTIAYETYYEGVKEGCEKTIFWTGGDPVDILTEMLEKLKEKGLLE